MTQVSYEDEVSRYQQDIALLKEDLELTRSELTEVEATVGQYKAKVDSLDENLKEEQQAHTTADEKVVMYYSVVAQWLELEILD